MLYDALERALERLNEMERSVASQDIGRDLRSVRDLMKKHQVFIENSSFVFELRSIIENKLEYCSIHCYSS